ncbi:inositol monophosphatase family protein [Phytohabitans rumicis]|uniref:Fructose 1,6-bisphosphatase n=1 Tax=Phytohabitans rumicis TaxID=1076125 RepID=A0A6V8L2L0_9ACTN|nr:inositol monophosphatase family protein [Phytohabitans rumicis]GFJ89001.1 fructose 1,6-bisphosphatase [Phytohabitans rumicis]
MALTSLVFDIAEKIAESVRPLLVDVRSLPSLGAVVLDKGGGHLAHEIDRVAEDVLFGTLKSAGYAGLVYSEESGLVRLGSEPRFLICDPYCNTSLTFRGVRESAVAVYEYTLAGVFVAGAIADLQIPRVVWADQQTPTSVTHLGFEGATGPARRSSASSVDDAFLVISLLKQKRRAETPMRLFRRAGQVATIDGAIVAVRLAVGEIDGFVDSTIGQPSYEALAYELVRRAGGVVTDGEGADIDFQMIVGGLANAEVRRQTVVAAANRSLHQELLTLLA